MACPCARFSTSTSPRAPTTKKSMPRSPWTFPASSKPPHHATRFTNHESRPTFHVSCFACPFSPCSSPSAPSSSSTAVPARSTSPWPWSSSPQWSAPHYCRAYRLPGLRRSKPPAPVKPRPASRRARCSVTSPRCCAAPTGTPTPTRLTRITNHKSRITNHTPQPLTTIPTPILPPTATPMTQATMTTMA